jgi:hypothetical protein
VEENVEEKETEIGPSDREHSKYLQNFRVKAGVTVKYIPLEELSYQPYLMPD